MTSSRDDSVMPLFTAWQPLNPRGLQITFEDEVQLATPPVADDLMQSGQAVDPWTASLEDQRWWEGPPSPRRPAVFAAQEVLKNRLLIETQPAYSLYALTILSKVRLAPPPWLSEILETAVKRLADFDEGSLDAAFGHQPPQVRTLKAARRMREKAMDAHLRASIRVIAGEPIDNLLFEAVGQEIGVSSETARKYVVYAEKELFATPLNVHRRFYRSKPVRTRSR